MKHRNHLLFPAVAMPAAELFQAPTTAAATRYKRTTISLAFVSATILSLGVVANASTQDNTNQTVLVPADIAAHAWHTGDPKKLVFKGNPVTMEHPGGDPDFLVDGDTIYVYTSTDANQKVYGESKPSNADGHKPDTYLNMDGYTVWSSEDMVHWTNHGVQFAAANMNETKWEAAYETPLNMTTNTNLELTKSPHAMWAPTAAKYTNGTDTTYVLYYPKGIDGVASFATGYATAPTPTGPFTDRGPLYGDIGDSRFVIGMDPNVFKDSDGQLYIYGNGSSDSNAPGQAVYAKLSPFDHKNLSQSLTTEPKPIIYDSNNTMYRGAAGNRFQDTDFHEGGSMHKSNGKYYFSWAEHEHAHYNGWYSMCDTPMGPCEWMGPTIKGIYYGNQHGSFATFKGKEYFLTHNDYHQDVKNEFDWDSYRRTWTFYPVTYNADKSIRVMYPEAASGLSVPSINLGNAYTDADGTKYLSNTYVSNGDRGLVDLATLENANPGAADLELYKEQRYISQSRPLNISVPVQDGVYDVTLKFAEIYDQASAGFRVMDIAAEDQIVKLDVDVFKSVGLYHPLDIPFSVAVTDGSLDVSITPTVNNAILNAVQISRQPEAEWALNLGGMENNVNGLTYDADPRIGDFNDNTTESITLNANEVVGATQAEEALFKTTRIGFAGLNYSKALPNGNYEVTLGFLETHHTEAKDRLFDVEIENILVLDDFDIVKAAGGRNVGIKRVFPIKLADGTLNIDLSTVNDASKISFIKVTALPGDTLDSSIRINAGHNLSDTDTTGAYFLADYQYLVGTSAGGSSYNPTRRDDLTYNPAGQSSQVKRDKKDADGNDVYVTVMATDKKDVTPTDEVIYQTERYGAEFGYAIPVKNGRYRVRLMFAEQYHTAAGMRKFTISLEGKVQPLDRDATTELDIYGSTGAKNKAMDLFFEPEVSDGTLNIDFKATLDYASITGIVVTPYYLKENNKNEDVNKWDSNYRDDQL